MKEEKAFPIVYRDNVMQKLLEAFENLGVVTSESMQHQNFCRILDFLNLAYFKLEKEHQLRLENVILTMLSVMGDHAFTASLDKSLIETIGVMTKAERFEIANAIKEAHFKLKQTHGKLNSRGSRV